MAKYSKQISPYLQLARRFPKNVQRWQALHSTHPPAALSSVTKQAPAIATCFLLFLLLLLPIILLLLLLLPLLLLLLYLGGT